jgi:hypothetical protein
MAAAAQGHQRVIALLAEMNADINQLDHKGRSAADVASESGAIQSLINLGVFFGFPIDRDRHLLPAIKRAEHLGSDCGLRSLLIWLDSEAGRRLNSPDLKPKVRAALKRLATKSKLQPADTRLTSIKMNIGLTFNARGEFQLVHDRPFATTLHDQTFVATPLWVGYHIDRRTLEVVYDTGGTYPIDWYASDEMHKKLLQLRTILIIRMKDGEPVEGYNTSVLRLRDGIAIDEY